MPAAAAPFALQSQYVPAVLAARAGGDDGKGTSDDDDDCPPPKKNRKAGVRMVPPKKNQNPKFPKKLAGTTQLFGKSSLRPERPKVRNMLKQSSFGMSQWRRPTILGHVVLGSSKKGDSFLRGLRTIHGSKNPWTNQLSWVLVLVATFDSYVGVMLLRRVKSFLHVFQSLQILLFPQTH